MKVTACLFVIMLAMGSCSKEVIKEDCNMAECACEELCHCTANCACKCNSYTNPNK